MAVRGPGFKRADVAQLVEHSLGKGEVTSSILVISSRFCRDQRTGIRDQLKPWRVRPGSMQKQEKLTPET